MNTSEIVKHAADLAVEVGINNVTRHAIAKRAGVSYGTAFNHLGNKPETVTAILTYAVENKILKLIADGIMSAHPVAIAAPVALKKKALNSVL